MKRTIHQLATYFLYAIDLLAGGVYNFTTMHHQPNNMIFIETPIFTEELKGLLSDDEFSEFQTFLADNPTAGSVI